MTIAHKFATMKLRDNMTSFKFKVGDLITNKKTCYDRGLALALVVETCGPRLYRLLELQHGDSSMSSVVRWDAGFIDAKFWNTDTGIQRG